MNYHIVDNRKTNDENKRNKYNTILYKNIVGKYGHTLSEEDFCPPEDNRVLKSGIRNVAGGDNFFDYCEYYFNLLDEEEYFDNE